MNILRRLLVLGLILGAISARAQDNVIEITKPASKTVPISISGLAGEAGAVVKFDLTTLGMDLVAPEQAEYLISGQENGRLEGHLKNGGPGGTEVFARAYVQGTERSQAHAFALDVARAILNQPDLAPLFQNRIAFCRDDGSGKEICVADYDGNDLVQMTRDGSLVATPAWAPGGGELYYTSWRNNYTQILEHNVATGERRVFAAYGGANFNPVVSPDGRKIAMILSKSGNPNLYVCDRDGGNLRALTQHDEASSPTWSPDSREICFVLRSGRAKLYKINAEGGSAREFPVDGPVGDITSPDWSPDGRKIIFTCGTGSFTIWVVPAAGGDAQALVEGEDPCWGPNSRTVIFTQRRNYQRVLSLLDVPTKHVKDVGHMAGNCSQPAWAR